MGDAWKVQDAPAFDEVWNVAALPTEAKCGACLGDGSRMYEMAVASLRRRGVQVTLDNVVEDELCTVGGPCFTCRGEPDPYRNLKPLALGGFFVAHNAKFFMGVLYALFSTYEIPAPSIKWGCTLELSRAAWPGVGNTLIDCTNRLGVDFVLDVAAKQGLPTNNPGTGAVAVALLNLYHGDRTAFNRLRQEFGYPVSNDAGVFA